MYLTKFAKASATTSRFALTCLGLQRCKPFPKFLPVTLWSRATCPICVEKGTAQRPITSPSMHQRQRKTRCNDSLVSFTSTGLCSYWKDPKLFDDMTESPSPISVAAASSASISALDNFADNEATQADSSKEAVSKQRLGALHDIKIPWKWKKHFTTWRPWHAQRHVTSAECKWQWFLFMILREFATFSCRDAG